MKLKAKDRKKFRVTNKVRKVSSPDRYRLSISRSSKNISAQIIDDVKNITLLSSSSTEKDIKSMDKVNKTDISKIVAEKLAKRAVDKKITKIYFDRGIYKYHGRS
jgi:large subunit ribosomal protein L18